MFLPAHSLFSLPSCLRSEWTIHHHLTSYYLPVSSELFCGILLLPLPCGCPWCLKCCCVKSWKNYTLCFLLSLESELQTLIHLSSKRKWICKCFGTLISRLFFNIKKNRFSYLSKFAEYAHRDFKMNMKITVFLTVCPLKRCFQRKHDSLSVCVCVCLSCKDGVFRKYQGARTKDDFLSFVDEQKWKAVEPISSWFGPSSILWVYPILYIFRSRPYKAINPSVFTTCKHFLTSSTSVNCGDT